ncbi:MAG: hypothetical protein K6A44_02710 [bacterium]|nr:hypothetical protein [bacterium]
MESIAPEFKNENERNIVLILLILTLLPVGIFIAAVIYFAMREYFSANAFAIFRAIFNFDIMLLLVFVALYILTMIIGITGFLMTFVPIVHLIVVLLSIVAIINNKRVEIPVPMKIFQ